MTPRTRAALLVGALALAAAACGDDGGGAADRTTTTGSAAPVGPTPEPGDAAGRPAIVFSGQGNDLVAYSTEPPFESQRVITNAEDDPEEGRDINAQICFWDDPELGRLFVAGEDTGQPDPPAGWGIFRLEGDRVGELRATQIGKLTPTYQDAADNVENYGCGRLSDGRLVTTDIGNQAFGPGTGQLIVWFPPFDRYEVPYCKIDVGIGTAQSIWVDDDDRVWVASSRAGSADRPAGVHRYTVPFPTGPTEGDGCGGEDATGAPMATGIAPELVIEASVDAGMVTPAGLAPTAGGNLYVSSVATGVVNEYTLDGELLRTVLAPPDGEVLDADSYSTGTPLGLGVAPDGTLYLADIGVVDVVDDEGQRQIGPGDGNGRIWRITFAPDGTPRPGEVVDEGLDFPDGIGVLVP